MGDKTPSRLENVGKDDFIDTENRLDPFAFA